MTDQPKPTVEERVAARQAAEDDLRQQLAGLKLDGPFHFGGFDPLSVGLLLLVVAIVVGAVIL